MGCRFGCFQFFRGSSAGQLKPKTGEQSFFDFLDGFSSFDISEKLIIDYAVYIGLATKGAISYESLRDMEVDNFHYAYSKAVETLKKLGNVE